MVSEPPNYMQNGEDIDSNIASQDVQETKTIYRRLTNSERLNIIYSHEVLGMTNRQIYEEFNVNYATVRKITCNHNRQART